MCTRDHTTPDCDCVLLVLMVSERLWLGREKRGTKGTVVGEKRGSQVGTKKDLLLG